MGKLLRKPRAPKPLPPLPVTPTPSQNNKLFEYFESIDFGPGEDDSPQPTRAGTITRHSPTPSVVPSLVSPPPSESNPRHSYIMRTVTYQSPMSRVSHISKDEKKFILDPLYREQTSLGSYVDGKSLVKPYKPRGPENFPARNLKRQPEIFHAIDVVDDIRFYNPPAFTLENFMVHMSEVRHLPLQKVRNAMYSRHNYKKLTKLIADETINPAIQEDVHKQFITPEDQNIPPAEPRIPQKQLLIEMAAMIKQHVRSLMNTEIKSVIKPLPKYSPSYPIGSAPHTEIILLEDEMREGASRPTAVRLSREGRRSREMTKEMIQESEVAGKDAVFQSATSRYFQGSQRSQSPFAVPEEGMISPGELAILDALINGGKALSLKAHFISEMPDISPLIKNVIYINLSFNDFTIFPGELLNIKQLQVLKLRNNPLKDLPAEIGRLRNLRTLVVSFCMLETLPLSLFSLENLVYLDISYNRISFIQNEICHLQSLRELNLEGNKLAAMPAGALRLNLEKLNVKNNFMHPLFWHEHTQNDPQRLIDLASMSVWETVKDKSFNKLPLIIQSIIKHRSTCDCCHSALFGPGLRIIRPVSQLFGIRNLPFMFRSCSPDCLSRFRVSRETLSEILYGRDDAVMDEDD